MRLTRFMAFVGVIAVSFPAAAQHYYGDPALGQAQYAYVGVHPVPYDVGSGFCYEQAAHYHTYAPFDQYLFRESNGYFYFVGDPYDFGYARTTWGYNGNHPIPAGYGGGWCYIGWGHRHHYPPSRGVPFNFVGGFYVYGGAYDPYYYQYRNHYYGYYDGYYRSSYYGGRYYSVRPPPVYRYGVTVGAPGVRVRAPGVGVTVGAPGVRVRAPGVGVTVGAPRPVPAPRPTYVPAPRPAYVPAPRPTYVPAPRPTTVPAPRPTYVPAPRPAVSPGVRVGPPAGRVVAPPAGRVVGPPGRFR